MFKIRSVILQVWSEIFLQFLGCMYFFPSVPFLTKKIFKLVKVLGPEFLNKLDKKQREREKQP